MTKNYGLPIVETNYKILKVILMNNKKTSNKVKLDAVKLLKFF